jgi:drug/metabolite transporter (DMT)-like permease
LKLVLGKRKDVDMGTLLLCVIAATFFGGWQLVMRASDLKDPFVAAFVLNMASAIAILPFAKGRCDTTTLFSTGMLIAIAAGVLNGIGHIVNARLVLNRAEEFMRFGTIVPAVVVLTTVLGGWLFYAERFSPSKTLGIALVLAGIALVIRH